MLKIGDFSKLSMLTVKTLRFYEQEGLLIPAAVDEWTGYRLYETHQLETAAQIKALRQLEFSVLEIKAHLNGAPIKDALKSKADELKERRNNIDSQLFIILHLMEEKELKYQAVIKDIPRCTVYSSETVVDDYSAITQMIVSSGEECRHLNPGIECVKPDYCFCEYLDKEYRSKSIHVRYSQAVNKSGIGNDRIQFRELPAIKAICIYHSGSYSLLGEAYSYLVSYAAKNNYKIIGNIRERYIDGMWNKECVDEWLTELQLPIE